MGAEGERPKVLENITSYGLEEVIRKNILLEDNLINEEPVSANEVRLKGREIQLSTFFIDNRSSEFQGKKYHNRRGNNVFLCYGRGITLPRNVSYPDKLILNWFIHANECESHKRAVGYVNENLEKIMINNSSPLHKLYSPMAPVASKRFERMAKQVFAILYLHKSHLDVHSMDIDAFFRDCFGSYLQIELKPAQELLNDSERYMLNMDKAKDQLNIGMAMSKATKKQIKSAIFNYNIKNNEPSISFTTPGVTYLYSQSDYIINYNPGIKL